ncbi:MAG: DHA2 family efflux MFS transporter permease subunit [Salinibacterium sp.]|nr:MAG: DHA2 family efflux MFS transporter permease subunit [Salinibacterium sp.]
MPTELAEASEATVPDNSAPDHTERNKLVINLLLISAFVVILNETIMNVALKSIMGSLAIDKSTAQWLSTGFMLTMAVVIPTTGFLLKRYSTRTVFIAAMGLFSLGTLTAAIAPGFLVLLLGRIIQASGTAIMFPLLTTTVMNLVPPATRGKTMGNISTVISVAPAIGPLISGLILSTLDWRWIFILVLPIALGALGLGVAKVKNVTTPEKARIDSLSVVLSAFAFGGLVFGLSSVAQWIAGHALMQPWIPLVVGSVAFVLFVLRQLHLQRSNAALLDLRTFRSFGFTISLSMMALMMMALFGVIIVLPLFMQNVMHLKPLATGALMLPGGLVMGLAAPTVGRLYDKHGPRPLLIPGSIIVSLTLWGMTLFDSHTAYAWVFAAYTALCLGLALVFTPLFTSSLGSVKPELYSHGSALIGTVQQLAAAAGTAVFIFLLTVQSLALRAGGANAVTAEAGGDRAAFICGAIISLLAVAASPFVTKPAVSEWGH